jgi:hypothetical protein
VLYDLNYENATVGNMKKPALITLVCLSYALASCGGGGSNGDSTPSTDDNNNNTQTQQLQWIAPSTRTDGSFLDLSELEGFKVYAGPTSNNLELIADVQDSNATTYDLSSLEPGEYYFGIVAYDSNGLQSPISDRITKTITE